MGCGFGGLLEALSPVFPSKLILGLEIRPPAVKIVEDRIAKLRRTHAAEAKAGAAAPYSNCGVVLTNFMKFAPNYFRYVRGRVRISC